MLRGRCAFSIFHGSCSSIRRRRYPVHLRAPAPVHGKVKKKQFKRSKFNLNHVNIPELQQPAHGEAPWGSVKARGTCVEDERHTPRKVPQL